MASGVLGLFGLARAAHLRAATDHANELKTRSAEFKQRRDAAQTEVAQWKQQAGEANRRLAVATQDAERWKSKDAGHLDELTTLRDKFRRLADAIQTIELTRGHLLTMETKLDVLEGAITVLDRRTRDRVDTASPAPTSRTPVATKTP